MSKYLKSFLMAAFTLSSVYLSANNYGYKALNENAEVIEQNILVENLPNVLKQMLNSKIVYPLSQQGKEINEKVQVMFSVNEKGELKVLSIKGNNSGLVSYVNKKIESLKVDVSESLTNKLYSVTFSFLSSN